MKTSHDKKIKDIRETHSKEMNELKQQATNLTSLLAELNNDPRREQIQR